MDFVAIMEEDAVKDMFIMHPSNRMLSPKTFQMGSQDVNLAAQQCIMLTEWANAPLGDGGSELRL